MFDSFPNVYYTKYYTDVLNSHIYRVISFVGTGKP